MTATVVVGVWCPYPALLERVGELQLVRLTLRRVLLAAHSTYALVPWTREMNHVADEVKGWRYHVTRCHTDERVAMRDLVATSVADIGVLVPGSCATIDAAEIHLAATRVARGVGEDGRYISPRVKCMKAAEWLRVSDSEEWPAPTTTAAEALKFYGTHDAEKANAREVWADLRGK